MVIQGNQKQHIINNGGGSIQIFHKNTGAANSSNNEDSCQSQIPDAII